MESNNPSSLEGNDDDIDDLFEDSPGDGDKKKKASSGATGEAGDLTEANIKEDDDAEDVPQEFLPEMAASSSPSDCPSTLNGGDDRDFGHGIASACASATSGLEHASPSEAILSSGIPVVDSLERTAALSATSNRDVAPGAFLP